MTARYCAYLDVPLRTALTVAMLAKEVQVPSGVGVLPKRTLRASVVPAGVAVTDDADAQTVGVPASRMRDVKVPAVVYGAMRTEETRSTSPPGLKSENAGRIGSGIDWAWLATSVPSM